MPRTLELPLGKRIDVAWLVAVSITLMLAATSYLIGPVQRNVIDHEDRLAVGRGHGRIGLASHRHPRDLLVAGDLDHRDIVVEPIADIQPLAVGRDGHAVSGMAGGDRIDDLARRRVDHRDRALDGARR